MRGLIVFSLRYAAAAAAAESFCRGEAREICEGKNLHKDKRTRAVIAGFKASKLCVWQYFYVL